MAYLQKSMPVGVEAITTMLAQCHSASDVTAASDAFVSVATESGKLPMPATKEEKMKTAEAFRIMNTLQKLYEASKWQAMADLESQAILLADEILLQSHAWAFISEQIYSNLAIALCNLGGHDVRAIELFKLNLDTLKVRAHTSNR